MRGDRPTARQQLARLLVGTALAVVVFTAVPVTLAMVAGLPVPRHWSSATLASARGLTDALAVVAWVAWAKCCWPVLRSVARRARRRDDKPVADAPLADRLAVHIVGALLVLVSLGNLSSAAGATGLGRPVAGNPAASTPTTGPTVASASGPPEQTLGRDYTVEPGDTLWTIAERLLGSGSEWPILAARNLGRAMPGGQRFLDPALIYPGWVLELPGGGAGSPGRADPTSARGPATAPSAVVEALAGGHRTSERQPQGVLRHAEAGSGHDLRPLPLPELAALGFGSLLAAALARRLEVARHSANRDRPMGAGPPIGPLTETAALLAPFADTPLLRWAEAANRLLRATLAERPNGQMTPEVRLVRVGPGGVDLWIAEATDRAPAPWQLLEPRRWRLPATIDPPTLQRWVTSQRPQFPVMAVIGHNDSGTWMVPLPPGSRLPVLGAESDRLVQAMATAAGSWEWAEQVVITDDPRVAEQAAASPLGESEEPAGILFVGDPADLGGRTARQASVITTLPVPASDLTITVDHHGASLHPLGITLRPDLLGSSSTGAAVTAMSPRRWATDDAGPARPDDAADETAKNGSSGRADGASEAHPSDLAHRVVAAARVDRTTVRVVTRPAAPEGGGHRCAGAVAEPGPVEVRLLTALPRIDGLAAPLPPKRKRRAIELVAYLALHHPDPVTGDRLRTRVLGSADADAAAKTLFNTAGAARRALGRDAEGQPYLPAASKAGLYHLSPLVTADASRAATLATAGLACADPVEAMALLRAALDLVEGEPLGGVHLGYGWWGTEGHEGRVTTLLVDAACELARLAIGAGHPGLGRWGVAQARMVEPYSEALTRAAMRVAAESGDGARLHREWVECRRRVDELDPGSLPSAQTERLYADLRRSIPQRATGAGEARRNEI
jgi:hypothetical protein